MSRLIDADLIDLSNSCFVGASEFARDIRNTVQMFIDAQPTAYDVEKVIAELEKLKKHNIDLSIVSNDEGSRYAFLLCASNFAMAIRIVQKGGTRCP